MNCENCEILTQRCIQAGELGRALLQENSLLKEALEGQQQGVDQSDTVERLKSQLAASEESYNRLLLDFSNLEQEAISLRQQVTLLERQAGPKSPRGVSKEDVEVDNKVMTEQLRQVAEQKDEAEERAVAAEAQRDDALAQLVDQRLSSVAIEAKVASLSTELANRMNGESWVMAELDVQSPHTLLSRHRNFLLSVEADNDKLLRQISSMVAKIRIKDLPPAGEEEMRLLNSVPPSALYLLLALASQQSLVKAEKRIVHQEKRERELEEAVIFAKEQWTQRGPSEYDNPSDVDGRSGSLLGVAQALDFQEGDEAVRLASEQLLLAQIKKGEQNALEMQSEMELLKRQTRVLLQELQLARDQHHIPGLDFLTPKERQSLLALIVEVTQEKLWTALAEIKGLKALQKQ